MSSYLFNRMYRNTLEYVPAAEKFFGRLTLIYGLWLLNPWLDPVTIGKGYKILLAFAPTYVWGAFFVVKGLRMWYASHHRDMKMIRDVFFGMFILWSFLAVTFLISNPIGTGALLFSYITYTLGWAYVRSAQRVVTQKKYAE